MQNTENRLAFCGSHVDTGLAPPGVIPGSRRGAAEAARVRRDNFNKLAHQFASSAMDTGEVAIMLGITPAAARKYVATLRELGIVQKVDAPSHPGRPERSRYAAVMNLDQIERALATIEPVAAARARKHSNGLDRIGSAEMTTGRRVHLMGHGVQSRRERGGHVPIRDPLVAALFGSAR